MDYTYFIFIGIILVLIICIINLIIILSSKKKDNSEQFSILRQELSNTTQNSINNMGETISRSQVEKISQLEERFKTFSLENEQKLENIRITVENSLKNIREDNNRQIEKVRETVDEKLQSTLESKINESFKKVSSQLESVYKGLGEMQNLATGVGDLKKVLTNVKTRGILGEVQLKAILEEILSHEQYEENVITKKGSDYRVEFAVKLPASDDGFIYLPIDSKFPGDAYAQLRDAYDSGDKDKVELAYKNLHSVILSEAKDISTKYIDVPNTTEFAIMFLPFEGLYSEVVNRGMIEELQSKYKVNIAGPSTMAALLNSIQMGFKTLAVQKRSAEVWEVLGSVKSEFENFNKVLVSTQKRLDQAHDDLDKLIGTRSNKIRSKLKSVQSLNIPIEEVGVKNLNVDDVLLDVRDSESVE